VKRVDTRQREATLSGTGRREVTPGNIGDIGKTSKECWSTQLSTRVNEVFTQPNKVTFSCTFVWRVMTMGKFQQHTNAARPGAAFVSIAAL
jgi:hypothetical protein